MTMELFISIFIMCATATSIAVQIIKTILDKMGVTYKSEIVSVIIAFIVGVGEVFIYYGSNALSIDYITVIYSICMGLANAVAATTGYDTVKNFIYSVTGKAK